MSYTREDIPALIVEFQKAKRLIAMSKSCNYFLCNALERSESKVAIQAMDMIRGSLEGHFTLQGWLNRNGVYRYVGDNVSRRLRIRWCDKIIADLKEYAK